MPQVFISRQPLVNRQNRILANRLMLHLIDGANVQHACSTMNDLVAHWPRGEKLFFINFGETPCSAALLDWPIPENTTVEISPSSFIQPEADTLKTLLQATQPSLCLNYGAEIESALNQGLAFRFVGFDLKTLPITELKIHATKMQPYGIPVAFNVDDLNTFQSCLNAGINATASWFFKSPPKTGLAKALNPGQAHIIKVLNLVRKNADIREIETALKQDVALSYKLLRYINSAGFGLSCEIQSFKHAVTILGYNKLNKWLSLLLATASKDPMAPAMMHTALTRARFMEIISQGLVDRQEYDNLFITGAFSMLDAMLGVSMEKVLESMNLPESISDALLGNGGVYGPFLDLARASEEIDGAELAEQANMLGLSDEQYNQALMQALEFAETMSF